MKKILNLLVILIYLICFSLYSSDLKPEDFYNRHGYAFTMKKKFVYEGIDEGVFLYFEIEKKENQYELFARYTDEDAYIHFVKISCKKDICIFKNLKNKVLFIVKKLNEFDLVILHSNKFGDFTKNMVFSTERKPSFKEVPLGKK